MKSFTSERGFTIVEVSVIVLVLGLLAFVGVRAYGGYESRQLASQSSDKSTSVATVQSTKDLDTLSSELDNTDVAGEFESELDAATTF